jgi:hypothetical protein
MLEGSSPRPSVDTNPTAPPPKSSTLEAVQYGGVLYRTTRSVSSAGGRTSKLLDRTSTPPKPSLKVRQLLQGYVGSHTLTKIHTPPHSAGLNSSLGSLVIPQTIDASARNCGMDGSSVGFTGPLPGCSMLLRPGTNRGNRRTQRLAKPGQSVLDARWHLGETTSSHQAVPLEITQVPGQHLSRDSGHGGPKIGEARRTGLEGPDDQQRPFVGELIHGHTRRRSRVCSRRRYPVRPHDSSNNL